MDLNEIKNHFNNLAEEYDSRRKFILPCFDDFYYRSVSLLKYFNKDFSNIVDLGAGTGLLTKVLYEMYPNANYTLIDVSQDMLKIAKERFAGKKNFRFLDCNYVDDIPVENCDMICSALSIHHMEENEKEKLYQNIYRKLNKGGFLLILDIFRAKFEGTENIYYSWWNNFLDVNGMSQKEKAAWEEGKKLDRENTMKETTRLLITSKFKNIECIYQFMKFGVIIAVKDDKG